MIDRQTLRRAWGLLSRGERVEALGVLILTAMSALASAVMVGAVFPFLSVLADPSLIRDQPALAWAYGFGGFTSDYGFLTFLGVAAIAVVVLANLLMFLNLWNTTRFSTKCTYSVSKRLIAHYLAQPYEYYLDRHSGDMTSNILTEAQQAVTQFIQPFAGLISALLTVSAIIGVLLILSPTVTMAVIGGIAAIYAIIVLGTQRQVRTMGKRRAEVNGQRFRIAGEALSGIKDIKLLGRETAYIDRYDQPAAEMARLQTRVSVISSSPQFFLQIIAFGGIILLCLALLDPAELYERSALAGLLPLLGTMALAAQRLLPQVQAIFGAITTMTYGGAAVDRIHEDVQSGSRVRFSPRPETPLRLTRDLTLRGVGYTYPQADRPGLVDVDLTLRAGERIGVVGTSGAGKTTLADVILGLLPPAQGTIAVDGTPIDAGNIRAWQRCVGYVPQDIFLIDGSLLENIGFGYAPEAIDRAKAERAARIAQLHDFAMQDLPDGYHTRIGERGVRLSGGQRQRIGIARALYHDADLIVFDEATSALDNLTEREVMAAIDALPGDKTVLIIAHRLSTVKGCDRIVVMDRGKVAGCGTWEALMDSTPEFRTIAEAV